jgi:hypothetical protein
MAELTYEPRKEVDIALSQYDDGKSWLKLGMSWIASSALSFGLICIHQCSNS